MAKERKDQPAQRTPTREARARETDQAAHERQTAEEPLDEQSLDRVMRECPL